MLSRLAIRLTDLTARVVPSAFAIARGRYESRVGTPQRNAIASGELEMIRPWNSRFPQTSIVRLEYTRGWDLDPEVQFFADGETGLRAYRLHAFEGDQRMILNVEHRFFLGRELFHVLSPGAAVFFDAIVFLADDVFAISTEVGNRFEIRTLQNMRITYVPVQEIWCFDKFIAKTSSSTSGSPSVIHAESGYGIIIVIVERNIFSKSDN